MKLLNEKLQIYSADMSELTFSQIRSIQNFGDNEPISVISAFYDSTNDKFVINTDCVNDIYGFCEAGLQKTSEYARQKLPFLRRKELGNLILSTLLKREEKELERRQEQALNPNAKFVSIGDDIFQISKIVSVKKRDEGNEFYIEVYVTNRHASVKKRFSSKNMRDFEFVKVQRTLELTA